MIFALVGFFLSLAAFGAALVADEKGAVILFFSFFLFFAFGLMVAS